MVKRILLSLALTFSVAVGLSAQSAPAVRPITVLTNATTGTSGIVPYDSFKSCRETYVYVTWLSTTTSGVITVETSDDDSFTGTWASLGTVTFAGTAPIKAVMQITGVMQNLRARISTTVAGGATPGVTITMSCN